MKLLPNHLLLSLVGDLFYFELILLDIDGQYERAVVQSHFYNSSFCCDSPRSTPYISANWRNLLIRDTFSQLDPKWNHHIGYLPLFNLTLSLFDLHLDYDRVKKTIDCTHFFYVPFVFTPFWKEIVKELKRMTLGIK